MMQHVKATKPPAVSRPALLLSHSLGLGTTALAVAQMVSFEEFVRALEQYGITGERGTVALAIALISLEVFAVPFLLRLHMSALARLLSALCVLALPYAWTLLSVIALLNGAAVENAGYLGGFLAIPVGALVLTLDIMWVTVTTISFDRLGGTRSLKLTQ